MRAWRRSALGLAFALLGTTSACRDAAAPAGGPPLAELRRDGPSSSAGELVGRWTLAEMLAPGGDAKEAARARAHLDDPGVRHPGLYAHFARAIYDEVHGAPKPAAEAYLKALVAARDAEGDPDVPLVAWYATHRLLALRGSVTGLFADHKTTIEALVQSPANLGWRAVAELVEWSSAEAFDKAEATGDAYDAAATKKLGCAEHLELAGPFGRGTAPDRRRSFGPEKPGPWPPSWPSEALRGTAPHVLKSEQHRCYAGSTEDAGEGVFYTQTFFTTKADASILLAVQGALTVWVDDTPVLTRDFASGASGKSSERSCGSPPAGIACSRA